MGKISAQDPAVTASEADLYTVVQTGPNPNRKQTLAALRVALGVIKTTSTTDSTVGRLLKVGDFGIGARIDVSGTDLNSLFTPGQYWHNAVPGATNSAIPAAAAYVDVNIGPLAGSIRYEQIWRQLGPNVIHRRTWNGTTWGAWGEQAQGGVNGSITSLTALTAVTSAFTMALPVRLGQFTLATLPSAATYSGYLIDVTNATGGAKICRSNGTVWQILNTTTTVS